MKRYFNLFLLTILSLLLYCCSADDNRRCINSIDDINNCKIGVLTNTTYDEYLRNNFPSATIIRMGTQASLSHALASGQCDAILTMRSNCRDLINLNPQFFVIDSVLTRDTLAVGFRHDDFQLKQQFDDFLTHILSNGDYDEICNNWLSDNAQQIIKDFPTRTDTTAIKIGMNGVLSCLTVMGNGSLKGFEPELMRRFGAFINRPVQLTTVAFNSIVPYIKSKKADAIICAFTPTEERSNMLLFSEPYFTDDVVCVAYKGTNNSCNLSAWDNFKNSINNNLIVENRYKLLVDGLLTTIIISLFSILLGTILGCLICFASSCGRHFWYHFERCFVNIIQGVPVLVLLMIMFYIIFANGIFTGTIIAIITFGLNFAASVSNMLCNSVRNIDKGQSEASLALGFNKVTTFIYFIIPQAIYKIMPLYKGVAIALVKSTSIVGYIAILDLTKAADIIRSRSFDEFSALIFISVVYFITAWLFGVVIDKLSKRLFSHKKI